MVKLENEYFIRFVILLVRGATPIARHVVTQVFEKKHTSLVSFLQNNEEKIRNSTSLTKQQKKYLQTVNPTPDLSEWDISLLVVFALSFLRQNLNGSEIQAMEKIRDFRNRFQAHTSDAAIDFQTYNSVWTQLTIIISTFAHTMDEPEKSRLMSLVTDTASETLDISSAIAELKLYSRLDEGVQNIVESLESLRFELTSQIQSCHQDVIQVKVQLAEMKTQLESKGYSTKIINTMYGAMKITANGKEIVSSIERRLIEAYSSGTAGHNIPDDHIRDKMNEFIRNLESIGVKVEEVKEGSIVFVLTSSSLSATIELIDYFQSQTLREYLNEMENILDLVFQDDVILEAYILIDPLQKFLETLKEKVSSSSLHFTMTCTGLEGIEHALDVFGEDAAASNALNSLSKALSDEIGEKVMIETSIDMTRTKLAIQSTKEQIDTISTIDKSISFEEAQCTECLIDGIKNKDPKYYCPVCESFLCIRCEQKHALFKALRRHVLLENQTCGMEETDSELDYETSKQFTEECSKHPGKTLDVFCPTHVTVNCVVCCALNHRLCNQDQLVAKVAKKQNTNEPTRYMTERRRYILVGFR